MFSRLNILSLFAQLILLLGCVYDPPNPGPSFIYNCSDEAIYVYHSKSGKLEMEPRLVLFEKKKDEFMFENTGCSNLLKSPKYRINAYEQLEVTNPFPIQESQIKDSVVYYFITERTMRESSWEEIVNQQLYERRMSLSLEAYNDLHRVITYTAIE